MAGNELGSWHQQDFQFKIIRERGFRAIAIASKVLAAVSSRTRSVFALALNSVPTVMEKSPGIKWYFWCKDSNGIQ